MKKIFYTITAILLISSACKKSINWGPDGKPAENDNKLSGTSWRITASTSTIDYGGGTKIDVDLLTGLPTCFTDNIITYLANGKMKNDEGATKCNANDPQSVTDGTWTLSSDEKKLSYTTTIPNTIGLTKLDSEVLQLDAGVLKIRYITKINGPEAVTTTTYSRVK